MTTPGPSKELWLTDPEKAKTLERGDPRQLPLFDVDAPPTPPTSGDATPPHVPPTPEDA